MVFNDVMPYSLVQGILEINEDTIMRSVACIKTKFTGVFCNTRILFTLTYDVRGSFSVQCEILQPGLEKKIRECREEMIRWCRCKI
jgi:hypothetical protein